MMNNRQLAEAFTLIADLLEIKGEVIYKTLAYRKASESLTNLGRDVSDLWREGGQKALLEIPGVGKAIAEKIDAEVRKLVDDSYKLTKKLLLKYRDRLDAVAQKLLEVESLTREEFESIFPPPFPKKSGTPQVIAM